MLKRIFSIAMVLVICLSMFMVPAYAANNATLADDVGDVSVGATYNNTTGVMDININGFGDENDTGGTWNRLFAKYRNVIVGISGIGAITMIALFIFMFMKLGSSAGNPSARSQALTGVLWTGIAAAGLGAVTIITGFFYNAI